MDSRSRGWRRGAVVTVWLVVSPTLSAAPSPARAAERGPTVPAPAAATSLTEELAGLARALADARAHFDETIALRPESALELLSRAQVAFLEEDYPQAVSRLLDLTSRPDFQRSLGYGEALTWLGEALWQLGFVEAGTAELRRALAQPASPTAFRQTLLRYLALAPPREPLEPMRIAWQRHQELRTEGPLTPEDREVRYRYAKALFRGGALAEADALFAAIAEGDPFALRALYFQGVIHVTRGETKAAGEVFEAALTAWKVQDETRAKSDDSEPAWWDVEPGGTPPLTVEEVAPVDPETVLDEGAQAHARVGQTINLALARLAATRGALAKAVAHYRRVPPGSPDHAAATQELVWAYYRRGEYGRGARLIDQLLAGRGDDRTAAELAIWKAHLLALDTDYTESEANYRALETALDRRRDELESDLARDGRVFPDAVLAWTDAPTAVRARRLESELVEQEEAVAEAREIAALLQNLFQSPDLLPGVRAGKGVHRLLSGRLEALQVRLAAPAPTEGMSGATTDGTESRDALRQSATRLAERLARFAGALDGAEARWRKRIREVLSAEVPELDTLERRLADETSLARRLGMAMAVGARQKLDDYAADAHFRQIDLAWWRVDEVRRHIKDARAAQRTLIAPIEAEVGDLRRELVQDPIPGVDAAELQAE